MTNSAPVYGIIIQLRNIEMTPCNDAADMLEFFFSQLQMHSPDMGGNHSYRFRSGGWPMTHCRGPNAEDAVKSAIREIKKERNQST